MSYRVYDYDEYDPREDNAWGVFDRFEDFVKEYKDKLAFLEDETAIQEATERGAFSYD